jgi:N-methylhydantoinase A
LGWRVGVDIGGAFTDLLALNEETGELKWVKVESTPKDYSQAVRETLSRSKLDLSETRHLVHGQTVVINTIITRSGSKVGLVTTDGFDILEIGRANRRDLFNLKYGKPEPFVPRYLTLGVKERIGADGNIITPLDGDEVKRAVKELSGKGCIAIAVSLINSYANPIHEQKAGEIAVSTLEQASLRPFVTLGHELSREWREYERTSTAVLNAYVQPELDAYVTVIENTLSKMNFKGTFFVMLAAAGMATSTFAKKYPIFTVEGGPVAGIVGGTVLAEILGYSDLIVLDGGSTTTKAGLVKGLLPRITTEYYVDRDRFRPGYPLKVPVVEVIEVGNGGTSIAWVDDVGALKVGPKAAGADPGPVCYGKGGLEPTLTDAYVIAGYLNSKYLLGGELEIHRDMAEKALMKLASKFSVSAEEMADAIIRVSNDQAAHVIRLVSVQKGFDPREFTLIAHGGSGPMFAPFIATELQIPRIVVPAIPAGVFNAWGMLVADIRHDIVHTDVMKIGDKQTAAAHIDDIFSGLEKRLQDTFKSERIDISTVSTIRYGDMRYYGQEHTIKVPLMSGKITSKEIGEIEERFIEAHRREYGFILENDPVEMVNFHVAGLSKVKRPSLQKLSEKGRSMAKALKEEREVYLGRDKRTRKLPIYQKDRLPLNKPLKGPAIVEEITSTIVITDGFKAIVDKYGNVILTRK